MSTTQARQGCGRVRMDSTVVKIPPDEDSWRTGRVEGRKLWIVPNEVGGLTLMFPGETEASYPLARVQRKKPRRRGRGQVSLQRGVKG